MKKREGRRQPGAAAAVAVGSEPIASRPSMLLATGICVVAGAIVTLAFAPFSLFPLAWVGVAVLFVAWERATLAQAVVLGFAFGFGLFAAGGYWPLPGLLRHGGYSTLTAVAASLFIVLLLAAHDALAGVARAVGGKNATAIRVLVVMPCAFVLAEWLRTFTLSGFPWLALGYAHIDAPMAGLAPLGGVYLISLASAFISGLLAYTWLARVRWMVAAGVLAAMLALGWVSGTIEWTRPLGRPLEIAAVQGNVTSEIKWTPAQLQPTLDLYAAATLRAMQSRKLDVVVWPETAITARPDQVAPFLAGLDQATRSAGTAVVFGIIDVDRTAAVPRYFNAVLATGTGMGTYHKRQLAPLTEYLPAFLPEAWSEQKRRDAIAIFTPGADVQAPLRVAGIAIGTTICYETAFGRLVRDPSGAPGILVGLTNDDWFMSTTMPAQDHQVARMRARESGRPMLRVANSGITAWIDADGRVVRELPVRVRDVLYASMQPRTGLTPYWRWGEWTWLAVAALMAGGAIAFHATRRA